MSISSVGGASALSRPYSAQQAQALSAVSVDAPTDSISDAAAIQAGNGNALTGTSKLASQTLQALLDLTQQDPSDGTDPSQASQSGQAQGAHHRHGHHHGGGMMQAPSGGPPQPSNATADDSGPSLTAAVGAGDENDEASLASALVSS